MQDAMQNVFGFSDGFKSEDQRNAYEAISVGKKNVIISMKTHAGKSAAYMIVGALQAKGIILVISPCLALLKNHCDYLNGIGLNAGYLSKEVWGQTRRDLLERVQYLPAAKFLYVTPEMILKSSGGEVRSCIGKMCVNGRITHVILDEVIRNEEFRADLTHLTELRAASSFTPWIVLTTASNQHMERYKALLGVADPEIIRGPCVRRDIFYEVFSSETPFANVANEIRALSVDSIIPSGIIYTKHIDAAVIIVEALKQSGIPAEAYFADRDGRFEVQEKWTRGEIKVIVATSESFGYGLIKSPLSFVFHFGNPTNLRTFYLESGRACGGGILRSKIYSDHPNFERNTAIDNYIRLRTCRHRFIANQFDDVVNSSVDCGNMCDNCIRNSHSH